MVRFNILIAGLAIFSLTALVILLLVFLTKTRIDNSKKAAEGGS